MSSAGRRPILLGVMLVGGMWAALTMLLPGWAAGPVDSVLRMEPAGLEQSVRVNLKVPDDSQWELTEVQIVLDGAPLGSQSPASEPSGRPDLLWSGVVAPGPHTLVAFLSLRARPSGDEAEPSRVRTVEIATQHRWEARPLRPLVLLITPVRPSPPQAVDPPIWTAIAQPAIGEGD
jgi:hypothetical protein